MLRCEFRKCLFIDRRRNSLNLALFNARCTRLVISFMQQMRRAKEIALWMLLTLAAAAAAAVAANTTSPKCTQNCGQVLVPYPFGIEPGCPLDGFAITCRNSNNSHPRAFLGTTDIEVTEISLQEGQIRVQVQVGWQCYNESGVVGKNLPETNFNINGVYKLSNDRNKLTVIGCNSVGFLQSQPDDNGSYAYLYYTGCLSYCKDVNSVIDGVCNGIGCCQTSFPGNLSDSSFKFSDYDHSKILDFSPCSYVFIVDQDYFNFSAENLKMDTSTSMPLWLDWAIRNVTTCEEAERFANYSCKSQNSVCSTSRNGGGYLCNCSQGYQGNPYVDNGCQDINECMLPEQYPCYGVCSNLPGSYQCACPPGKYGDPFSAPCIPKFPFVVKAIIGISLGSVIALAVTFATLTVCQKRRLTRDKEKIFKENWGWILYKRVISRHVDRMTVFTLPDLRRATNNFHDNRVLGRGGHGIVYKGRLEENRVVAIKKTVMTNERQGEGFKIRQKEEFLNEINILSQINHKNVVRLFGCCLEEEIPILVYEFVPNGTLSNFIHRTDSDPVIPLDVRLRIAAESAEALAYLHSSTSHTVIHGDVKPSNILLDDNLMAKVSDFGASTLMLTDQTQTVSFVQGTPGYIDPVFLETGHLTKKTDVYSFGVVLLELVTRKRASWNDGSDSHSLAGMSMPGLLNILDEQIVEEGGMDLLGKIVKLAIRCLRRQKEERPTMKRVAEKLQKFRRFQQQRRGQHYTDETDSLLGDTTRSHTSDSASYYRDSFRGQTTRFHTSDSAIFYSFKNPEALEIESES